MKRRLNILNCLSRSGWPSKTACVLLMALSCAGCGTGNFGSVAIPSQDSAKSLERTTEKGPVKLTVRVTPDQPRLSDLVEMDVAIEYRGNVEIKPLTFGKSVGDFLIRDYSERPLEAREGKQIRRFHYQLEPAHSGLHLIRSVAVEFVDRRPDSDASPEPAVIESEPLEIEVTSELGEGVPDLAQLEPMAAPRDVSGKLSGIFWWIAALAGTVFVVVIVLWRRRTREPVAERQQTPEEVAQAALGRLLAEDLPARGLVKEFFLRLTGIVRQYIEDTTGIRAPEQTTEEFLRDIRAGDLFAHERSVRLAEFLEAADMIKYAGQQPRSGQIEDSIARAREFILPAPVAVQVLEDAGRTA